MQDTSLFMSVASWTPLGLNNAGNSAGAIILAF